MYKEIGEYGIIGNLRSAALVGPDGSIDWCCLPHLDSPSVFAALLDEKKGGRFCVCPTGDFDSVSRYIKTTNILTTSFRTRTGTLVLTDFMPMSRDGDHEGEQPELYRMAQVTAGQLEVEVDFSPRFNYARAEPSIEEQDTGILARGPEGNLTLCCSREGLRVEDGRAVARWRMEKGDYVWLYLKYDGEVCRPFDPKTGGKALRATESFWHRWVTTSEEGEGLDLGPFKDAVERSALVLKLLQFHPTGAISAAATTSLPEQVGGVRNWDYRFSWVRDTALTLEALLNLGHLEETERYLRWIEKLIAERRSRLQVLYDLQGEPVAEEQDLDHLEGYKGSKPVRAGNRAVRQLQLDTFGEIMDAAWKVARFAEWYEPKFWPFLKEICETVVAKWREKDSSIWEVRSGPQHFVFSKVMCWVALDRGERLARRFGREEDAREWEGTKEEIRRAIYEKGWNEEKQAFVQHFDTAALDASVLLLPVFGFIDYDDPKMVSTVEAIRRELSRDGFIFRYRVHKSEDGLPGEEGVFLVCSFWLARNLVGQGRLGEAERILHRMQRVGNRLGLFSEEYDLHWETALGNYPQALTHIGFINAAVDLARARAEKGGWG